MAEEATEWILCSPRFEAGETGTAWEAWASDLAALSTCAARIRRQQVETWRSGAIEIARELFPRDRQRFEAAARVACDLARQGWGLDWEAGALALRPPTKASALMEEKARVRAQLHVSRDKQLSSVATRLFLRRMETRRHFQGQWVSIYSLMRDGQSLARALRAAVAHPDATTHEARLADVIQPYLQPVEEGARCAHTGLELREIWRYFRHTWANPYRTTPGRNLDLLIRDAAAPYHPVIGVASIISSAAQIAIRDDWIGWSQRAVVRALQEAPSIEWAEWLWREWRRSFDELFINDFLEEKLVTSARLKENPPSLYDDLVRHSQEKRREHERFAHGREHKSDVPVGQDGEPLWEQRARTSLYQSKRARRLADLLRARRTLDALLAPPSVEGIRDLVATPEGRWVVGYIARRAKADRMGVAIADIGVCGAVAPYNHLLGGKLVSMLMASPEVRALYASRYGAAQSVIASSTAGRSIIRHPHLVLLMTTSLYGAGSSQYNRLAIPCDRLGGTPGTTIRYEERGLTQGFGTSQFSNETIEALGRVTSQELHGQRNNSFFGEGTNPRLRKAREGLHRLGLDSDGLLRHGSPKVVYSVPLVRNLQRFLVGLDEMPDYLLPQDEPRARTDQIATWWRSRWLAMRVQNEEVLARVAAETLTVPVQHGARVLVPPDHEQLPLF